MERAVVHIPAWGVGWVDVGLIDDAELSGAVDFVLNDITIRCAVKSGGTDDTRSAYRVAFGAGAWHDDVPSKGYSDDAGAKVSVILRDLADAVGEQIGTLPSTRLGPHYARAEGSASRTINGLLPKSWYVDFTGITQTALREPTTYTGDGVITEIDPAMGIVDVVTDVLSDLVPGVQVEGNAPATDIEITLTPERITTRVYSGPQPNRRLDAFRKLFDAFDPWRQYRGVTEFRVVTLSGDRLNLQPVRVATGMPDLSNVPVRPGAAGLKANTKLGSLVLVSFVEGDPSRPVVTSHDAPDAPGWSPDSLDLETSGQMTLTGSGILTDGTTELGAAGGEAVALAPEVLTAIDNAVIGHTHAGVTPGGGSTGPGTGTPATMIGATKVKAT